MLLEHVSTQVAKDKGADMADCLEGEFLNDRCLSVWSKTPVNRARERHKEVQKKAKKGK